ncbi:hypothetical protein LINPERPRIM_LOCUS28504 [Linum perenne]
MLLFLRILPPGVTDTLLLWISSTT